MIHTLKEIDQELSKKQLKRLKRLFDKYKNYDKIDILIELSKKRLIKI